MSHTQPLRCLQLCKFYFPVLGGIESVVLELTEGLLRRDVQIDVLCANTHLRTVTDHLPYPVTRAGSLGKILSTSMSMSMVGEVLRRRRLYDVIHVHLPDPMTNLALYLARPTSKIVVHWHNDIINQQNALKLYHPLQNWLLRRADAIIATTTAYAEGSPWLRSFGSKIHVIPIGIQDRHSVDETARQMAALRHHYGGGRLVFALGRLTYYKGFDVLIRAAAELPPDVRVVIGGGGALAADLAALVRRRGVADRVHLVGPLNREQVRLHHRAADVFCLPSTSRAESFGVVLLEAMAASRPIVATRIEGSGVPWVNVDGETGINVPVGDPHELARALTAVLDDPVRAAAMGRAARQRFEDHFTAERMVQATARLYDLLLGR